jgi:DNA-binding CsgD family transcriptional regulator
LTLGAAVGASAVARSGHTALTPRQSDCIRLTAEFKSSKEIGLELRMSQKTVDAHIAAAIKTLGARNRRDAARMFAQNCNDSPSDKLLRQTSRLADSPTIASSFPPQTDGGCEEPQGFQEQGHGHPPALPWNTPNSSFRTFLEGVKPDDLNPTKRAMLIVFGTVMIALALATTVTFADVLSRLTDAPAWSGPSQL